MFYSNLPLRHLLLTVGLPLLFFPRIAAACVMCPRPTVLQAYQSADVVVIARAVSQKTANERSLTGTFVVSTTMQVEKVFKGKLRVGDQLTFGQGNGIRCTWVFYEDAIGEEYLFYLESPPEGSSVWYEFGYSRSGSLSNSADDLLYLNRLDAVRGKTRVSGTLDPGDDDANVVGKKIQIKGNGKVYATTTDKNGVYEFYDLRPGKYVLEPQIPTGWRIDRETRGTTTITNPKRQIHTRHVLFRLKPRQHAAIDLSFVIDTTLSGRVVDGRGRPLAGAEVWLKPKVEDGNVGNWDYTDEKGRFAIKAIEPGEYILVLNKGGEKRIEEPFPTLYYPGFADESRAQVFRVRAGDNIKRLKIVVPHLEEMVTVQGIVRFADGTPAPRTTVRFIPEKRSGIDGRALQDSDVKGRFSFKIFKGLPGELHADFFANTGDTARLLRKYNYENCPQVQSIIKETGEPMIKTRSLRIDPQHNLLHVVLNFPFRACK